MRARITCLNCNCKMDLIKGCYECPKCHEVICSYSFGVNHKALNQKGENKKSDQIGSIGMTCLECNCEMDQHPISRGRYECPECHEVIYYYSLGVNHEALIKESKTDEQEEKQ